MARGHADSLMSRNQEIGLRWEEEAFGLLETLGYKVEWYSDSFTTPFDLKVNGRPVEIKAAYPSPRDNGSGYKSTRYQFNLTAKQEVDQPWFLIAVAIDDIGLQTWFFIPGTEVNTQTISLTSHPMSYAGKWAAYRSNTDWLDSFIS